MLKLIGASNIKKGMSLTGRSDARLSRHRRVILLHFLRFSIKEQNIFLPFKEQMTPLSLSTIVLYSTQLKAVGSWWMVLALLWSVLEFYFSIAASQQDCLEQLAQVCRSSHHSGLSSCGTRVSFHPQTGLQLRISHGILVWVWVSVCVCESVWLFFFDAIAYKSTSKL